MKATPQDRYRLAIEGLAEAERAAARNPHSMPAVCRVIRERREVADAYAAIEVAAAPVSIGQGLRYMARRAAHVPRMTIPSSYGPMSFRGQEN